MNFIVCLCCFVGGGVGGVDDDGANACYTGCPLKLSIEFKFGHLSNLAGSIWKSFGTRRQFCASK